MASDLSNIQLIAAILLAFCWTSAAISDLRSMTIPNTISIVMIVGFAALAPLAGLSLEMIAYCLLASALTFCVCFGLFAINAMGGGDAKLLTASALWFGLSLPLVVFLVQTAFLGGLLTLAIVLLRARANSFPLLAIYLPSSLTSGNKIPYGIAISTSGIINLGNTVIHQL